MTKVKSTKRALLTSALALLLCVAMLVGTTYAWFTDSVVSGRNIIQSGNLDVVLEYSNDGQNDWKTVDSAADIFAENLWEPGYTKLVYFRVKNAGSLALKYELDINIFNEVAGKNVDGNVFTLSDYIYGRLIGEYEFTNGDMDNDANDRLDVRDYDIFGQGLELGQPISEGLFEMLVDNKNNKLEKGETSGVFAIALWMPETVGNEANHDGVNVPQIDLGVMLYATQLMSESDSFGNDYDKDAAPVQYYTSGTHNINENLVATGSATDAVTASGTDTVVNIVGGSYDAADKDCAVWAKDGATVNISGGTFMADGLGKAATSAEHQDMVYAGTDGIINISGGFFYARSEGAWLLNEKDNSGKIVVTGGTFVNWDPANNVSEGAKTNFLATDYASVPVKQANGDTWYIVVPVIKTQEDAQKALDNATDGAIVYLGETIDYGDLKLNVNENSELTGLYYYMSNYDSSYYGKADFQFAKRTINNLIITGVDGATVSSITTADAYSANKNVKGTYNNLFEINNLTISNITVANKISFTTSNWNVMSSADEKRPTPIVKINGLTIDKCKTTTNGDVTQAVGRKLLGISNTGSSSNAKNIVVTNCTVSNMFQGVYLVDGENVRIENNNFSGLTHNSIHINKFCSGNIVIANNKMDNVKDRPIRFNDVQSGDVTIKNTFITNSTGDNGQYFKASSMGADVELNWENNTISGTPITLSTEGTDIIGR